MFIDPTSHKPPSRFGRADNQVAISKTSSCPLVRTATPSVGAAVYKDATPNGVKTKDRHKV